MQEKIDEFSRHANIYSKYRPDYPTELFQYIFQHCSGWQRAWDCGTGNGQVAAVLASRFDQVFGTDISARQIEHAVRGENIHYQVSRAEDTAFRDDYFDLITVAQAVHWFDITSFNNEVKRVLKPNGVIAIWGYGRIRLDDQVNKIIDDFYQKTVGEYWHERRKLVESQYEKIPFSFDEIEMSQTFNIEKVWDFHRLLGYFRSWSSVQNYINDKGVDPVPDLIKKLKLFSRESDFTVTFPIFIRMGRKV